MQRLFLSLHIIIAMNRTSPLRHFHYFTKLPAELRLQIWLLCLPRRIGDTWPEGFGDRFHDLCFDDDDHPKRIPAFGYPVDNICKCESCLPFAVNSNRPVISAVCREARDLVLRYGPLEECDQNMNGYGSLFGKWHMWRLPNWSRAAYYSWGLSHIIYYSDDVVDWSGPEETEIIDEWRRVFDRTQEQGVTFCTDWSLVSPPSEFAVPQQTAKTAALIHLTRWARNLVVPLVVRQVTIHIMRRHAATTNLFGRLAEEPCQDVDIDDTDTLAEYYALWDTFTVDKHKKRVARREVWRSLLHKNKYARQVAESEQQWRYQMLLAAWYDERQNPAAHHALAGVFPSCCNIELNLHTDGFPHIDTHPPDYSHPWVAETWAGLPTLRPMIRFRLCPDPECLVDRGGPRFRFKRLSASQKLKQLLLTRQRFLFRGQGRWRWRAWAAGIWDARRGRAPGLPYHRRWRKRLGISVRG